VVVLIVRCADVYLLLRCVCAVQCCVPGGPEVDAAAEFNGGVTGWEEISPIHDKLEPRALPGKLWRQ
jgi:hypothetical protein